jgi:hypothetical protein
MPEMMGEQKTVAMELTDYTPSIYVKEFIKIAERHNQK